MRNIDIEEQDEMLILHTIELDGYSYLRIKDGKADTSLLDEFACKRTFDCNLSELKEYIKKRGY